MANPNRTVLAPLVALRADGWLHCRECSQAFWGAGNATALVAAKAQRHAAKAHKPAAQRPQRRNAQAGLDASVDVQALAAAAAKAAKAGVLPSLGAGVFRQGYAVSKAYVIKLAKRADGRDCNLAEAQTYASAPAHLRVWLCPVVAVAPDGEWVMMRYADRVGQLGWDAEDRAESAMGRWIADLHGGNLGTLNGHLVITDYAASHNGGQGAPVRW